MKAGFDHAAATFIPLIFKLVSFVLNSLLTLSQRNVAKMPPLSSPYMSVHQFIRNNFRITYRIFVTFCVC